MIRELIAIMLTTLLVLIVIDQYTEPGPTNMYGGVNYTVGVYRGYAVVIPDENAVIKCSYLVSDHVTNEQVSNYDCEDGQGIVSIVGGD